MRVLLIHNRYRAQGGEERTVDELERLLGDRGHTVRRLERSSTETSGLTAARGLLAGGLDPEAVGAAARALGAEVVHAHNLHPLLGWRALAAAREAGARTVLHLQNFRLSCAIGVAFRGGEPCFQCSGADTRPGLRHRCRGSLAESAVYTVGLHRQHPELLRHAERFVTVSEATASRLAGLGLPADRTAVLPNFLPDGAFASRSRADQGEFALAAGRLVAEKGFDTAITAARGAEVPLLIAGSGPDEGRLRRLATGAEVTFTGWLGGPELAALRRRAALVLAPSRWEEPCPYAVAEAMADGVPVLASDRGGLPEMVGTGAVLPVDDQSAWRGALERLWRDPDARVNAGEAALSRARQRCSEDRYYERLLELYRGT